VKWEEWYFNAKRQGKCCEKKKLVRTLRQRIRRHRLDQSCVIKGVIREIQSDDRHEHQQTSDRRIDEEFDCRVDSALAAPDPDQEEHRNQRGFEEEIEQQ
jgi:hypothetical protein